MKRILLGIALLFSVIASGQVVIGGGKVIGGGGGGLTTEEKADLGYAVDGQYFLSKASNNITTAITNINNLYSTEGKRYALIIDHDLDLSGVSASTITIPSTIPVIIKPGNKIITPIVVRDIVGGTNPITGTVAANYVQIQINGQFIAPKNQQIFEGDGLIWFGNQSVDEITPMWWGMKTSGSDSTTQANNVRAFQMAINSVVLDKSNRATSKVKLPNGSIYMNSPVVAFACAVDDHPFLTGKRASGAVSSTILNIEGAERVKHEVNFGNTTNIYYTATWGAPLMLQGLRNSSIQKIRFEGVNNIAARNSEWRPAGLTGYTQLLEIVLRPDNFTSQSTTAWVSNNLTWGKYQPYAAIITDPFRTVNGNTNAGFMPSKVTGSTLGLYYGETSLAHQNSWDVKLEHMHFEKFVTGIVNTLTGQQGDTYVYRDLMFSNMAIGISTIQDQSRDCKAYEVMGYGPLWALFDTKVHGNGCLPEIMSAHSAGGLKYLVNGGSNDGIVTINGVYAESIYAVGGSGTGGTNPNNNFPSSISNSTFKTAQTAYSTAEGEAFLYRKPTIDGYTINNTVIAPYTVSTLTLDTSWQAFANCILNGVVYGAGAANKYPIDAGWFYNIFSSTIKDLNEVRTVSYPNHLSEPKPIVGTARGEHSSFYVPYSKANRLNYRQFYGMTIEVNKARGFIDITGGGVADLTVGSTIFLYYKDYWNIAGSVYSNDGTTARMVNILKSEFESIESDLDVNNKIIGTNRVYLVGYKRSYSPFRASTTAGSPIITVEESARYSTESGFEGEVPVGSIILMPDNKKYRIIGSSGNTRTLSANYPDTLSNVQIESEMPVLLTNKFYNQGANGGRFLSNGYYSAGERYEYWSSYAEKTTDYVICTKSGNFYDAMNGSVNAPYKANFLRYRHDGVLIDYISGETTIYPISSPVHITFKKSGTTAQRPDNVGIPNDVIPYGYIYSNTDTGTNQFWNGTAFVEMGDGTGTDDQTASEVAFTPTGSISATNVQSAVEEVGTESVRTTIAGFTGTPLTAILQQTKAQMDSDGPAPSGTMVVCEDCPLEETITGSTVVLKDTPIYIDNRTADATSFSFSNLAVGREATIDLQQTGAPTYTASGVTFTRMSLQDFEDETRLQVKFKVQSLTEILYSYYKAY